MLMLRSLRSSKLACLAAALPLLVACERPQPVEPVAEAAPQWPRPQADAAAAGDWPTYNRDLAGTRFSPLKSIRADNVGNLRQAWVYAVGRSVAEGAGLTPLAVAGVLYLAAADRIVALRADTGEELWRFPVAVIPRRSLVYWPGQADLPARVYFTSGQRLVALEAATGIKALGFGREGEIEMPAAYAAAPTRFENLLLVGSNGAPGGVRALDARTGTEVWSFSGVPRPGDPGHETWLSEGLGGRVHVPHEPMFTIDVDRALVYAVLGGPGPSDYYGGARLGDTLFGNSIVALDVRTGRRRWHFQTVRHDIWGYDLPAAPSLLDARIRGEVVPLLAVAGETGYVYLLNRATGVPVFGIEERSVPPSDVPGETTASAQPIPLKPGPIARVSFAPDDLVTAEETTPEHADVCRALAERSGTLHNAGPFTPYAFRAPDAAPRATLLFPGVTGGPGWGGTAADASTGYVFVNTSNLGTLGWFEPDPSAARGDPDAGADGGSSSVAGGPRARFWADAAGQAAGSTGEAGNALPWPCQKPPWGELVAIDAATGDLAWRVPLGITEELPEGRRRTGRPSSGGPIVTAGGVVFIGATDDRRFRAFDARTGAELWQTEVALSAQAVPITYEANDGKQYVVIAAAGAGATAGRRAAAALVAYALP